VVWLGDDARAVTGRVAVCEGRFLSRERKESASLIVECA
jgi:hypothetical protein